MAVASAARERDIVYPEERLPWPQTILLGVQHVMAMFGATVLVPLILGFNPNTVIFFSGIGTLIFLIVTGRKVPSYLGSSFSFIGAVLAIQGGPGQHQGLAFAGIALAGVAVTNFQKELVTGTITFLAAAIASVYLRGFPRLLPVLIGVVVGYLVAGLDQAAGGACASAASGCHVNTSGIGSADWLGYPKLTFPDFSDPVRAFSLFWFIPIVLVAENTGHVFAIGGIMKRDLSGYLGRTFMGDGLATTVSALFGGTGETTYAENIGVMGITRVFSIWVFIVAAVTAILLGFIPKFGALVLSIPISVLGGIELYLFGLIAVIGAKIWVDARVDFSKRANLAVAAIPLILAAGGADLKIGSFEINNLGIGALGAIVLYQILRPGHMRDTEAEPAEVVAPT